jgi:hypothetical protein
MTNPHVADLSGFAQLWGMQHLRVKTADDLDAFETGRKPTLMEIIPDAEQTKRFWEDLDKPRS